MNKTGITHSHTSSSYALITLLKFLSIFRWDKTYFHYGVCLQHFNLKVSCSLLSAMIEHRRLLCAFELHLINSTRQLLLNVNGDSILTYNCLHFAVIEVVILREA